MPMHAQPYLCQIELSVKEMVCVGADTGDSSYRRWRDVAPGKAVGVDVRAQQIWAVSGGSVSGKVGKCGGMGHAFRTGAHNGHEIAVTKSRATII
jgi:hypothetical protein